MNNFGFLRFFQMGFAGIFALAPFGFASPSYSAPPSIEELPPEIHEFILSYCDQKSLLQLSEVSHYWRNLSNEHPNWKNYCLHIVEKSVEKPLPESLPVEEGENQGPLVFFEAFDQPGRIVVVQANPEAFALAEQALQLLRAEAQVANQIQKEKVGNYFSKMPPLSQKAWKWKDLYSLLSAIQRNDASRYQELKFDISRTLVMSHLAITYVIISIMEANKHLNCNETNCLPLLVQVMGASLITSFVIYLADSNFTVLYNSW